MSHWIRDVTVTNSDASVIACFVTAHDTQARVTKQKHKIASFQRYWSDLTRKGLSEEGSTGGCVM